MFYAVKVGRKPGIYPNWGKAEQQVKGFSGAVFKKFNEFSKAREFLNSGVVKPAVEEDPFVHLDELDEVTQEAPLVEEQVVNILESVSKPKGYEVYVDGSFNAATNVYGSGFIVLKDGEVEFKGKKSGNDEKFVSARNVAGEILAAVEGLRYITTKEDKECTLYFDYEGIGKWANGEWEAKSDIAKFFIRVIDYCKAMGMVISFKKVQAHSGVEYNEMADSLAKEACGV